MLINSGVNVVCPPPLVVLDHPIQPLGSLYDLRWNSLVPPPIVIFSIFSSMEHLKTVDAPHH